jgi:hypothetical protein
MRVVIVEAGDVGELLAARLLEAFADLLVDLFQRLDAVGAEGGRDHGDPLLALLGQPRDLFDRVGLQPFLGAEPALEGGDDLGVGPAQPFLQQA